MNVLGLIVGLALLPCVEAADAPADFESDVLATSVGELKMTFIGHGTLMFQFDGRVIHVDPVSRYADYARLPDADLVLVTHEHGDHLDEKTIEQITKQGTLTVATAACAERVKPGVVMKNGDVRTLKGLKVEAVPAYNVVHMRSPDKPYHPKGTGNGYVITFGGRRVYVAGDTENIPEMADLEGIDVAFLPMNLPYTMTPEMVADSVRTIRPKILYPYHFGKADTSQLVRLLENVKDVEVRIRKMQ